MSAAATIVSDLFGVAGPLFLCWGLYRAGCMLEKDEKKRAAERAKFASPRVKASVIPQSAPQASAQTSAVAHALSSEPAADIVRQFEPAPKQQKNIDEILGETFAGLHGMNSARESVKRILATAIASRMRGGDAGRNNVVLVGAPGVGKTSLARRLGQAFSEVGLLSKGHLIEVSRSDLVGEFIGSSEALVKEKIEAAKGGVLFIDEFYALASGGKNDFGRQVLDSLLVSLENERDIVFVIAGYPRETEDALKLNPGLASRFQHKLHLQDYCSDALVSIFKSLAKEKGIRSIESAALDAVKSHFERLVEQKNESFANAREARNFLEACLQNQALRCVESNADEDEYRIIRAADVKVS